MTIIVVFKKSQMKGQGDAKHLLFAHRGYGEIEP